MDYGKAYTQLHEDAGGKWFPGSTIKRYTNDIADLVRTENPRNLLDFGSGKGYQYLVLRIHEQWGGLLPYCYDVGVRQLARRPLIKFDGVICTDMLEHIEEADIPVILDDIFGFLTQESRPRFAFFSIACRPDSKMLDPAGPTTGKLKESKKQKKLPDGRDVHVTVQPPAWWIPRILQAAHRQIRQSAELKIRAGFELMDGTLQREVIL